MTTETLITPKARLAFPALFEARSYNNQPAKFSATLVFDKAAQATPEFAKLKAAAGAAAKAKFGDKIPKTLKSPFRDGEEKDGVAGFNEDDVFINITSKRKPRVVDRNKVDGKFPDITDEDRVYPGCYVRASVSVYAYDKDGGKGVAFGMNNVQFLDDGERIASGGGSRAEGDFDDAGGDNVSGEGSASDIF